jgi:hypothetical protein
VQPSRISNEGVPLSGSSSDAGRAGAMTRDTAGALTRDTAGALTRDTAGAMTRDTALKAEREVDKIHIQNEQLGACMAEELLSLRSTGQGTVDTVRYYCVVRFGTVPHRRGHKAVY